MADVSISYPGDDFRSARGGVGSQKVSLRIRIGVLHRYRSRLTSSASLLLKHISCPKIGRPIFLRPFTLENAIMEDKEYDDIGNRLFWTDLPEQYGIAIDDHHGKIREAIGHVWGTMPIEEVIRQVAPMFPNVVFEQKGDDIGWRDKPKPPKPSMRNVVPLFPSSRKK
jgi:hypothetical protein